MGQNEERAAEQLQVRAQLDITAPKMVQVEFDSRHNVLYVHVDGYTVLRICKIADFEFFNCSTVQKHNREMKDIDDPVFP